MGIRAHRVARVKPLGAGNYVLYLEGPFAPAKAGQFCMLSADDPQWPGMLPRPMSYFDLVPGEGGYASFLIQVIGGGTRALVEVDEGETVLVTTELGRGFPEVDSGAPEPICIAGGVGLAPFLLWVKQRGEAGARVPMLYGAANAASLVGMEEFRAGQPEWYLATDDGSRGFAGNVLELYRSLVESGTIAAEAPIYCCGPDPMMHAVAVECEGRGLRCWVSLENYMPCGYGVCNACSVRVRGNGRFAGKVYAKSCVDGPVFDATELVW